MDPHSAFLSSLSWMFWIGNGLKFGWFGILVKILVGLVWFQLILWIEWWVGGNFGCDRWWDCLENCALGKESNCTLLCVQKSILSIHSILFSWGRYFIFILLQETLVHNKQRIRNINNQHIYLPYNNNYIYHRRRKILIRLCHL